MHSRPNLNFEIFQRVLLRFCEGSHVSLDLFDVGDGLLGTHRNSIDRDSIYAHALFLAIIYIHGATRVYRTSLRDDLQFVSLQRPRGIRVETTDQTSGPSEVAFGSIPRLGICNTTPSVGQLTATNDPCSNACSASRPMSWGLWFRGFCLLTGRISFLFCTLEGSSRY